MSSGRATERLTTNPERTNLVRTNLVRISEVRRSRQTPAADSRGSATGSGVFFSCPKRRSITLVQSAGAREKDFRLLREDRPHDPHAMSDSELRHVRQSCETLPSRIQRRTDNPVRLHFLTTDRIVRPTKCVRLDSPAHSDYRWLRSCSSCCGVRAPLMVGRAVPVANGLLTFAECEAGGRLFAAGATPVRDAEFGC